MVDVRSKEQWTNFFINIQIPADIAETYAEIFIENRITETNFIDFTKEDLQEIGITTLGDIKAILRHQQHQPAPSTSSAPTTTHTTSPPFMKTPAAKLPQLTSEMTKPQFRKFKMDWQVYKHITNLPESQIHAHLYNSCDDYVQTSLVNTAADFFTLPGKINSLPPSKPLSLNAPIQQFTA